MLHATSISLSRGLCGIHNHAPCVSSHIPPHAMHIHARAPYRVCLRRTHTARISSPHCFSHACRVAEDSMCPPPTLFHPPPCHRAGYARDTTMCVDYFVGLQDFGVWSCFDAGNDEFVRDATNDRYCLLLDHDKCVRGVGVAGEAVMLRVPGEAACLQLDDARRPLITKTCDESMAAQKWHFDPPLGAFRAASQPSLCLDYALADQAFAVWSCDAQEQENARAGHGRGGPADHGFVYHRYSGKYCLRRGHGATCVQEASGGSRLLLRRPTMASGCLQHTGTHRRALSVECDASAPTHLWVYHSSTGTFRAATDDAVCLDLFPGPTQSEASAASADALALMTADDGGALGSWACQPHVPNQVRESTCASLPGLSRARSPHAFACTQPTGCARVSTLARLRSASPSTVIWAVTA